MTVLRSLFRSSLFLLTLGAIHAARIEFTWPTPNPAWDQRRPIEDFIQPTVSGDPESGLFGCVRNGGSRFHEGLDLKPVKRDRGGEPADPVFAAMRGVVRYVSTNPGGSSYGRYIVIEHPDLVPAVQTLYGHLARVEPGIRAGMTVEAGQVIGLMGRSSSGQAIPKDRGHLHFEISLRATDNFQSWYNWKKFGSPNEHGAYNGYNLMGINPLDFLREWRANKVDDFQQYFDRQRAIVRVRVVTSRIPDFIQRYPALLRKPMPMGLVGGWDVECNSTGLPFGWTPLTAAEVAGARANSVQILSVDSAAVRAYHCKALVKSRRDGYAPGTDLEMMLQLVFGLR